VRPVDEAEPGAAAARPREGRFSVLRCRARVSRLLSFFVRPQRAFGLVLAKGDLTMNDRIPLVGMTLLVLLGMGGGIAPARAQDKQDVPQVLNEKTFDHWRDFIHPSAAESAWERPGWQTSLWAGLTLAQEKKQPLLAWFMTGHPCGMT
jgi:hypothetical protein